MGESPEEMRFAKVCVLQLRIFHVHTGDALNHLARLRSGSIEKLERLHKGVPRRGERRAILSRHSVVRPVALLVAPIDQQTDSRRPHGARRGHVGVYAQDPLVERLLRGIELRDIHLVGIDRKVVKNILARGHRQYGGNGRNNPFHDDIETKVSH